MSKQQHPTTNTEENAAISVSTNPFNALFDDQNSESDDEWWEDEDVRPQTPEHEQNPLRITQWPAASTSRFGTSQLPHIKDGDTEPKRYSVQRPVREKSTRRQKKQNAKAGIKVVTSVARHRAPPPVLIQSSQNPPQQGCFVDLAALNALNGETRSKNSGKFWKSKKTKGIAQEDVTLSTNEVQDRRVSKHEPAGTAQNSLMMSSTRTMDELSPADRPIVIGLSIPSRDVTGHTISPQTASSEASKIVQSYEHRTPTANTPQTPTIIITPAQDTTIWSILDSASYGSRAASSIYSQAPGQGNYLFSKDEIPSVPRIPDTHLEEERMRLAGLKSYFSPDSDDSPMWMDEDEKKTRSRVVSTCTVFEEDESPILVRNGRVRSMSGSTIMNRKLSVSTTGTRRQSTGWWNYITTPFITRSNTFANRTVDKEPLPALPNLAIAAYKAREEGRDQKTWEKAFSPESPPSATTVTSDRWWEVGSKINDVEKTPDLRDTRHKVEASTGTLPIMIPEIGEFVTVASPDSFLQDGSDLRRTNTTSTFHSNITSAVSPNDREVPMVLDTPVLSSNATPDVMIAMPSQAININIQSLPQQTVMPHGPAQNQSQVSGPSSSPQPDFPPPPYSPPPARLKKYRPVFPPGHTLADQHSISQTSRDRYAPAPTPVSPGLHAAMTSQGSIPLSDVPLTPASRQPINLNSGYPSLPDRQQYMPYSQLDLSSTSKKAEAKRRRHEKEDALAHRAGGLWRGRGCLPNRGCYGRGGAEGRKRRRWYLGLVLTFLSVIILAVVLATQLVRKSSPVEEPSRWLNLTGFPPILTGLSTVIAPINIEADTGCVFPSTQWSCHLPKELQNPNAIYKSDQPSFLFRIQWDNSTEANRTFANVTDSSIRSRSNPSTSYSVSASRVMRLAFLKARQVIMLVPNPLPPLYAEQFFLGNTTDSIASDRKAGEPTPFYISLVDMVAINNSTTTLSRRQAGNASDPFPDVRSLIPGPSLNADGTAAPANLLPFPAQQPLRLYDRGLNTEHYGFYTYYDRSIFLKSIKALDQSNLGTGEVPDDKNGGARVGEAKFRCTWRETRFLVQIWTKSMTTTRLLNTTRSSVQSVDTINTPLPLNTTMIGRDLSQPGSFPYPVTITLDRHGGDPAKKMLYCYGIDDRKRLIVASSQIHDENRGFGGTLINQAPSVFSNTSDPRLGGFDGGTGGCACKWRNFEEVVRV